MIRSTTSLLAAIFAGTAALGASEPPRQLVSFLDAHCLECHDADTEKGGLNLLDLDFAPGDPALFPTWQRVYERVRDGEMPPEKRPRPEADELKPFLAALSTPLLEADRKDIAERGRVRGRRLTRLEYENSLHDLLHVDIPLASLLPEDPATHGFETVAEGQQLSYHQLARYLDTADLALGEAFRRALKGDEEYRRRFTPKDLIKRGSGNYRGPDLRDGRSISWPIGLQFFGRLRATAAPASGWYRITLQQVQAVNPGADGAVWGTLRTGFCDSNAPLLSLAGLVEATAEPRDLVYEAWIEKGHQIELRPNDATLKRAPSGATGGNVSFKDRDLAAEGYSGIAHRGIVMERIHPRGSSEDVHRALFGGKGLAEWEKSPEDAVATLLPRFARLAFRRPVTKAQLAPHREIALAALGEGSGLAEALRAAYRSVLCSPRFLGFVEPPGELDAFALASRVSYALWCGPPDRKLLEAAANGSLRDPDGLAAETERLLSHPKSARFVASFTDQWLQLKEIDFTAPDPRQFSSFDPVLQESLVQETRSYFRELLDRDLGASHLVASDFTHLNGRLARHYRIDAPLSPGGGTQRVSLPENDVGRVRGGFATQGAILKVTADGTHTSPVVRGVFVNERLLGVRIPEPPPGIPAIEPDIRGAVSIRDQLSKHRESESCISCHLVIDPPGFALENFDPIGGWRRKYGGGKGVAVDPSGTTREGDAFDDIVSWMAVESKRSDRLARGFVHHFLTYATGAAPRFSDEEHLEAIVAATTDQGHGLRSLVLAAVASPVFLSK